ncbi:exopolysaccharide biosynthesis protein [Pseudoxanthomonas daejeonensis]|uniref:Exopolysaccharide biosynthesis protein n=1 Tax=Pseudoxanthomonas daejeonensis TaxID=266062 RepID=A0ABQ6Z863_9GAMM|nr:exopolysaccharide biosynthesis protein [Pseudoxanthomonas daejeonensis]KAF1694783.1 exopolysaccharide biosynthesis protein [Pseudoxanthomonas daejeonensis]
MTGPDLSRINDTGSLGDQLEAIIGQLPEDHLSLGELLEVFGDEGLLLLTILLTLVFLIPVSIPGVSTVFGAAILLVGISRLLGRPLWLPAKLRTRPLPAVKLRPALTGGLHWVRRLEKISRPYRLRRLVEGRAQGSFNNLAFILAALLLMVPFSFIPFSNTLPALALLFYAIGMIQRDGTAILLGHLANIGTIIYFGILIGGGGMAAHGLLRHFTG